MDAVTRHRHLRLAGFDLPDAAPQSLRALSVGVVERDLAHDGDIRHLELRLLGVAVSDPPDLTFEARALVAALAEFTGESRAYNAATDPNFNIKHPRGPGGRFRNVIAQILGALEAWANGDGSDDPFKAFPDREPLRLAAKHRGIPLRRGAKREEIVEALKADVKAKRAGTKDAKPEAGKPVRFTLKGKAHRDLDVGVFTENGKVSLWEVSDNGERRKRVALVDDLAALEAWADEHGESELAGWARSERGGAEPTKATPAKRAPAEGAAALEAAPASLITGRGLTTAQKSALRHYQDQGAHDRINNALRQGQDVSKMARVAQIDAAMESSPLTHDVVVDRGAHGDQLFGDPKNWPADLTGREWTEAGYLSTSAQPKRARGFGGEHSVVLRLHVPAGTPAVAMSRYERPNGMPDEAELLLGRGLHLRVTGDRMVRNEGGAHPDYQHIRVLDVEVAPASSPKSEPLFDPSVHAPREAKVQATADALGKLKSESDILAHLDEAALSRPELDALGERLGIDVSGVRGERAKAERIAAGLVGGKAPAKATKKKTAPATATKAITEAKRLADAEDAAEREEGLYVPPRHPTMNTPYAAGKELDRSHDQDQADDALEGLTLAELREVAQAKGLTVSGHTAERVRREIVDALTPKRPDWPPAWERDPGAVDRALGKLSKLSKVDWSDSIGLPVDPGHGALDQLSLRERKELARRIGLPTDALKSRAEWADAIYAAFISGDVPTPAKATKAAKKAAPTAQPADLSHLRTLDPEAARDELDLLKVGTVDDPNTLRWLLRKQGLPVSGKKRDLVDRLVASLGGGGARPAPAPTVGGGHLSDGEINGLRGQLAALADRAAVALDPYVRQLEVKRAWSEAEIRQHEAYWRQIEDAVREGNASARRLFELLIERDGPPWGGDATDDARQWSNAPSISGPADREAWSKLRNRYVTGDRVTVMNNASLRSGEPTSAAKSWASQMSRMVRSSETLNDTTLHRGAALPPDQVIRLRPGAVVHDPGIVSTDESAGTAAGYASVRAERSPGTFKTLFEIRVPRGTPATNVGSGEVVLDRGNRFRIISSMPDENGVIHVVMELIR